MPNPVFNYICCWDRHKKSALKSKDFFTLCAYSNSEKRIYFRRILNSVMWVKNLLVSLFKKLAISMFRQLQMGQHEKNEKSMTDMQLQVTGSCRSAW